MPDYAFAGFKSITSVELPNCSQVSGYAFKDCIRLSSIVLPSSISFPSSPGYRFASTYLENMSVPNVDAYDFFYCTQLKEVTLTTSSLGYGNFGKGKQIIAEGAFKSCVQMTQVNVAVSGIIDQSAEIKLYSAAKSVFENCYRMKKINLFQASKYVPLCRTVIPENAFRKCVDLSQIAQNRGNDYFVYLNNSQSTKCTIGSHAFDGCSSLSEFRFGIGSHFVVGESAFTNPSISRIILSYFRSTGDNNPTIDIARCAWPSTTDIYVYSGAFARGLLNEIKLAHQDSEELMQAYIDHFHTYDGEAPE